MSPAKDSTRLNQNTTTAVKPELKNFEPELKSKADSTKKQQ